tara:strand:- start:182 stop:847 length:666 start_codon:yes stop_codon:yes gene_type:complete
MSVEQNITKILRVILPDNILKFVPTIYYNLNKIRYKFFQRSCLQKETSKAKNRREKENFFELYCKGYGADIGYGGDLLVPNCKGWDIEDGDAQYIDKLLDKDFDFLYSSHLLEHLDNPEIAIKNWWRVVKKNGYMILYLPDRDLYEKKKTLPSRFSLDHKHFFNIEEDEAPNTIGVMSLLKKSIDNYKVIYSKICDEGCSIKDPYKHSNGEYSIEVVIQKL